MIQVGKDYFRAINWIRLELGTEVGRSSKAGDDGEGR